MILPSHPSGKEHANQALNDGGGLGSAVDAVGFQDGGCVPAVKCWSETEPAVDSRSRRKNVIQRNPGKHEDTFLNETSNMCLLVCRPDLAEHRRCQAVENQTHKRTHKLRLGVGLNDITCQGHATKHIYSTLCASGILKP